MEKTIEVEHWSNIFNHSQKKKLINYFIFCLLLTWGSVQIVGAAFSMLFPELDKELISELRSANLIVFLFFVLFVAPLLESAILVYSIHISKQIFSAHRYIYFSIIPVCLMHLFEHWQLFFIALLPFYFQAVAYISIRAQFRQRTAFLFLIALHFFTNLISMTINIVFYLR